MRWSARATALIGLVAAQTAPFDAVLSPTCPLTAAPAIAAVDDDQEYNRINALLLRNTAVVELSRSLLHLPALPPGRVKHRWG